MNYKKLLKNSIISLLILLLLCAMLVLIFDPFYHYHKPIKGLKAVLSDKEYQCIGSLKNFDYDSLIVGSSVCENYNNRWFDEAFGVKSIKAIRSYGGIADLDFFLKNAFNTHNIKYVFYNIDPGNLANEPTLTFEETGCPMYLYDNNPINDIEYLLNKDVLMEKIPYMISKSLIGDYDEGESYNWWQWKNFGTDETLSHYYRSNEVLPMNDEECYKDNCEANIALIEKLVKANPDTEFIFFYPPYSFLWFDNINRCGDTDAYLYNMKMCTQSLLKYENVSFFNFINDEKYVGDLDNYMDALHFTPDINNYIVDVLKEGDSRKITADNIDIVFDEISVYARETVDELILSYGDAVLSMP